MEAKKRSTRNTGRSCPDFGSENLVEFILREGDLDNRQGGTADREAMLLGGRIHRKDSKADGKRISCGSAFADGGAL